MNSLYALFGRNYSGALGNMYSIWREDIQRNLSLQAGLMNSIQASLPKYFSRAHKAQVRLLTEKVLFNKIMSAKFCAI